MKKLLVMVIAMALVFGMSAGVMALDDPETVDVNITFLENAILEVGGPINFEVVPPSDNGADQGDWLDNSSKHGGRTDLRIESNTDFKVTIEENVTSNIIDEFDGIGHTDVVTNDYNDWYDADGDAWIYFNIEVLDNGIDGFGQDHIFDVTNNPDTYSFWANQGVVDTQLQANININNEAPRSDRWTNLTANETVKGQLTVTVEAN